MNLYEWQRDLQASILTATDQIATPLANGSISREREIGVYADAYFLRLAEALQTNYPVLHQILGDDDFYAMAQQYIQAYPSVHPSIRWFGGQVAQFLAQEFPYSAVPILSELARFEWALRHTVDAADAERLTLEDLQAIPAQDWGSLCFTLHPSLRILDLQWNVPQVWQAISNETEPPAPETHEMTWLVWRRPDLALSWRSASMAEIDALNRADASENFAQICEGLIRYQDEIGDVPLAAASFLRGWIEQGLMTQNDKHYTYIERLNSI